MLRYSVSYYEKVAGYWMQLRKGEESFKTRKEAEEFIDVLKSCPEISDAKEATGNQSKIKCICTNCGFVFRINYMPINDICISSVK